MLGKKTQNPRPVSLAEVKAMLSKRSAEPDFGYEQQLSLDYSKKFCKLTLDDAQALKEELSKISALTPEAVVKLADILPAHAPTLQAICAKDKILLEEKDLNKALELIRDARKKMIAPEEPAAAEGAKDETAQKEEAKGPQNPPASESEEGKEDRAPSKEKDGASSEEKESKKEKKKDKDEAEGKGPDDRPRRKKSKA